MSKITRKLTDTGLRVTFKNKKYDYTYSEVIDCYDAWVEVLGEGWVKKWIKENIDPDILFTLSRSEVCGSYADKPTSVHFGLFDRATFDRKCGNRGTWSIWYYWRDSYQGFMDNLFLDWLEEFRPAIFYSFNIQSYGRNYGGRSYDDIYISKIDGGQSLYIPIKAIVNKDFSLADKRMAEYQKSFSKINFYEDKEFYNTVKGIVNGDITTNQKYFEQGVNAAITRNEKELAVLADKRAELVAQGKLIKEEINILENISNSGKQ